jgi:hypothetical protein
VGRGDDHDVRAAEHRRELADRPHLIGERSHVRGTPGLFLNGRIQDASPGLRALVATTEKILRGG